MQTIFFLFGFRGKCIKGPYTTCDYLRVGYNTAKGDLVRSILYPRPLNFKLYNDAFKFIVSLAFLGVMGFFYVLGVFLYHGVSTWGVGLFNRITFSRNLTKGLDKISS